MIGIMDHVWANILNSVMYIFLLWPMFDTSLLMMCHYSIMWSLITCLQICLALEMIHSLIIFVTTSLSLKTLFML